MKMWLERADGFFFPRSEISAVAHASLPLAVFGAKKYPSIAGGVFLW